MRYRIRRADLASDDDMDHLQELNMLTFDGDRIPASYLEEHVLGQWWLVHPVGSAHPVAYAGIIQSTYYARYAYFARVGVMPEHRGNSLQLRLERVSEKWARTKGFEAIISDTFLNVPSTNNLFRGGYTLFSPDVPWAFAPEIGGLYFRKKL